MTYSYTTLSSSPGFFTTDNSNSFTYPSTEGTIFVRPRDLKKYRYTDITDTFPGNILENPSDEFKEKYSLNIDENKPGRIFEWLPIDHIEEITIGPDGFDGLKGRKGPKGPDGSRGVRGGDGATGPKGATGPEGLQGVPGGKGVKGQYGMAKCTEAVYPDEYFTDDRGWLYISNPNSEPRKSNQIFVATGL